ncbi:MAG: orotidine 5'-phosphate decarboxylase [Candidatus Doudnabacteria bacterium]|nr:orotidine 5'-phosphate decarboxylase [Candidatus Doudnabacteria bacterium]
MPVAKVEGYTLVKNPFYLALDRVDLDQAIGLLKGAGKNILGGKLHQLIDRLGALRIAEELAQFAALWGDVKLHDTPDTVRERAMEYRNAGFTAISVHIKGGIEMMQAAKESGLYIIGITELTSLDEEVSHLGSGQPRKASALKLARDAKLAGIDAVVCSTKEVGYLSKRPELKGLDFIVPGSRSAGQATHDQKNVDTPLNVMKNGATALVLGRQVVAAADPLTALAAVVDEIAPALAVA